MRASVVGNPARLAVGARRAESADRRHASTAANQLLALDVQLRLVNAGERMARAVLADARRSDREPRARRRIASSQVARRERRMSPSAASLGTTTPSGTGKPACFSRAQLKALPPTSGRSPAVTSSRRRGHRGKHREPKLCGGCEIFDRSAPALEKPRISKTFDVPAAGIIVARTTML